MVIRAWRLKVLRLTMEQAKYLDYFEPDQVDLIVEIDQVDLIVEIYQVDLIVFRYHVI